jgi:hypothetical protein
VVAVVGAGSPNAITHHDEEGRPGLGGDTTLTKTNSVCTKVPTWSRSATMKVIPLNPRPNSPYPRHEYDDPDPPQTDDANHDANHDAYHDAPYEHNYADEREYTDDDYDHE